jgi:hypothetical protein
MSDSDNLECFWNMWTNVLTKEEQDKVVRQLMTQIHH